MSNNTNTKKIAIWALPVLLIIVIGLYPYMYIIQEWPVGLLQTKPAALLKDQYWKFGFYCHIVLGSFALLSGWSQFVPAIRNKRMAVHRTLGKIYVASAIVSGLAGYYIAFYATGGWVTSLGFMALAIIWLWTTLRAYSLILKKNVAAHQRMMIYSYAACLAAVTLRLWMPSLLLASLSFEVAYPIAAWMCWIPNMAVAHWIVRKKYS